MSDFGTYPREVLITKLKESVHREQNLSECCDRLRLQIYDLTETNYVWIRRVAELRQQITELERELETITQDIQQKCSTHYFNVARNNQKLFQDRERQLEDVIVDLRQKLRDKDDYLNFLKAIMGGRYL
jgi:prefoldin subunit 5